MAEHIGLPGVQLDLAWGSRLPIGKYAIIKMSRAPRDVFLGIADIHLLAFLGHQIHHFSLSLGDFPVGALFEQALTKNQDGKEKKPDQGNNCSDDKGINNEPN